MRDGDFALEGLLGFDLHGHTAGIVGTGQIGTVVARILLGFGCHVVAYDIAPNKACRSMGVEYVSLEAIWQRSDVITLHTPLTRDTRHVIDSNAIDQMKRGVMVINTGRGALVDTAAVIAGLKSGHIGYLGLDVYEEEEALFFVDLLSHPIQDDVFRAPADISQRDCYGASGLLHARSVTRNHDDNLGQHLGIRTRPPQR